MRIKLDENLPHALASALAKLGHDVDTVIEEGLRGSRDEDVWSEAQRANRLLITQDLDFSDLRRFAPGTHAGLLLIRLANPSRSVLFAYIQRLFETEDVERWNRCVVVGTETKVRVRRPQPVS